MTFLVMGAILIALVVMLAWGCQQSIERVIMTIFFSED